MKAALSSAVLYEEYVEPVDVDFAAGRVELLLKAVELSRPVGVRSRPLSCREDVFSRSGRPRLVL